MKMRQFGRDQRQCFRSATVALMISVSQLCAALEVYHHTGPCPPETDVAGLTVWRGADTTPLNGWSHIDSTTADLHRPVDDYRIDLKTATVLGCPPQQAFNVVLVKKYHDWHQQHLSGLEASFTEPLSLHAVTAVSLTLRVHSQGTTIPGRESYRGAYTPWLSGRELAELDQGHVTLGLTLYDPLHADQSIPSLNGTYFLTLDPKQMDQWLQVTVPIEEFDFYWQENWKDTATDATANGDHPLVGLRINPETDSGKVVRHYIPDTFGAEVPPLYKEIDVALIAITLELRH